jgi:DNA repair photolyase
MNTPRPKRYCGPLRLIETEFKENYGSGNTIFIEHKNDLFAADVPQHFIDAVMIHCRQFPNNTYVFQTKNPARYFENLEIFPEKFILGTTIETNRETLGISNAPRPVERAAAMCNLDKNIRRFVTIEPLLDFDVDILAKWISDIKPDFFNLGADSKGNDLPEPTAEKIHQFISKLKTYGSELREKPNLKRLLK